MPGFSNFAYLAGIRLSYQRSRELFIADRSRLMRLTLKSSSPGFSLTCSAKGARRLVLFAGLSL
jgi:hypothetical protein